jgi:signal recognition particle receptor subunit beta
MLIVLNKSDLPSFTSVESISEKMNLYSLKCKDYLMLPCSAFKNDGVSSSLNWIIEAVRNHREMKTVEESI